MKENTAAIMPSGAEALGNICTALVVFSMIPMMFGLIDNTAVIGLLCWMIPCFVFVIIAVTLMLKEHNIAAACLNATMTGVLLCNLAVRAVVILLFMLNGTEIPATVAASFAVISAGGFITGALLLVFAGLANLKVKNQVPGGAMLTAAAGFILMAIGGLISNALTLVGFILLLLVVAVLFLSAIQAVTAYILAGKN